MEADLTEAEITQFLASLHPYDTLPADDLERAAAAFQAHQFSESEAVYSLGDDLPGLFVVHSGAIAIHDERGAQVSLLGPRNSFGERGLLRDGISVTAARAAETSRLLMLPAETFHELLGNHESFARFFDRTQSDSKRPTSLATVQVSSLLTGEPVTCAPQTSILEAAQLMRERKISSLAVVDNAALVGIVTTTDLSHRVVAEAMDPSQPVSGIMTRDPITLEPDSLGSDVLHIMHERHIGHLPIVENGKLRGMVSQTDLTRMQAVSSAQFVADIAHARSAAAMAQVTAQIPQLLATLVGAGNRHEAVTRLITDIADAATRRLLRMAEAKLGPPPVPYLWLACGSQGRREQTGVSDQDNCLILDDSITESDAPYFEELASFVCDGLNTCGYVHCPGDMMASNPKWRQPLRVWRDYFAGWIAKPVPEAQVLASVMFDLRPIGGSQALFSNLHAETLEMSAKNSIFVAHMVSNSLKHTPPLGLLRGFARIRDGQHKNAIDMKMSGVVPVVDLARVYSLQGKLLPINTRARLLAAAEDGVLSKSGSGDLLDAYDMIAHTRLEHQARRVKRGEAPDNYLNLSELSDLERSHLRDAFVVVRTMQSSAGQGRGTLS